MNQENWSTILNSISQNVEHTDKIIKALTKKLSVDVSIIPVGNKWQLSIIEGFTESPMWNDFDKFFDALDWTEDQLRSWPDVEQTNHNEWTFTNLRSAEKFKTLFSLQWAK